VRKNLFSSLRGSKKDSGKKRRGRGGRRKKRINTTAFYGNGRMILEEIISEVMNECCYLGNSF